MKILLVKPHPLLPAARTLQRGFLCLEPLELEIVAGGIPRHHRIRILDLSLEAKPRDAFVSILEEEEPDLVGFTGYSTNAETVKEFAALAKSLVNGVVTVVGGIHATIVPDDYAGGCGIDLVVRGEGGTAMTEIIRRIESGEPLHFPPVALSTAARDFAERTRDAMPKYPPVERIPAPRRDLVDRQRYFCAWTHADHGRLATMYPRTASLRTSLGCPFSCSFCVVHSVMSGRYLQRDPEEVVDEIEALGEDHIYLVDDESFVNGRRMERIARLLLERGIRKKFISWARSDTVVRERDLLALWKEAGLDTVYVGLESLDEKRLGEYQKRTNVETNRRAIDILRELGLTLHASFIVHPQYTVEDFRRLEREVLKICPAEVSFTVLSPSPGTDYFEQQKDEIICHPYRYYDCMHTLLPTRLPLKLFYAHFARLTSVAMRANPLRMNKVKLPHREIFRAIVNGTRYIFALRNIYRDYPEHLWKKR